MKKKAFSIQLNYDELEYVSEGGEHVVFKLRHQNSNVVIKFKKQVRESTNDHGVHKYGHLGSIYEQVDILWHQFLRQINFMHIFPDLHNDFHHNVSEEDIKSISHKYKGDPEYFKYKNKHIIVCNDLFHSVVPKFPNAHQFFIEVKPKCMLRAKININEILANVSNINLKPGVVRRVLKSHRWYPRKMIITSIKPEFYRSFNFYNKKKFSQTFKVLADGKYMIFRTKGNHLQKTPHSEIVKAIGCSEIEFVDLLRKCFYYKHPFYNNAKTTVFEMLNRFCNLYPYSWLRLKPHLDAIKHLEISDESLNTIFASMTEHVIKNYKICLPEINSPHNLLMNLLCGLISNVFSDCSIIFDFIIADKNDRDGILQLHPEYKTMRFKDKYCLFKANLIDTGLKQLTKASEFVHKEEQYFRNLFEKIAQEP